MLLGCPRKTKQKADGEMLERPGSGDVSAAAPRGFEQINSKPNCTKKREAKLRGESRLGLVVTLGDRDRRRLR